MHPWELRVIPTTMRWRRTISGLYKAEDVWRGGPWRSLEAVEYATLEWVGRFNNRRLLEPVDDVPPAEFEQAYHLSNRSS